MCTCLSIFLPMPTIGPNVSGVRLQDSCYRRSQHCNCHCGMEAPTKQFEKEGKMGETTNIEWCHHTFNPWIGCVKVAQECQFCYAESFAQRFGWKVWGPASTTERRVTSLENWKKPLKWNT